MANEEIEPLLRALAPIRTYLPDENIVLSGGWVPFIYRRYVFPGDRQPTLKTMDVDVVVAKRLKPGDRPSLRKLLLADGFEEHFVGDANPPASCFKKEIGEVKAELEFLTPQIGAYDNQTQNVQADLAAPALRYSDILMEEPLLVSLKEIIDGEIIEIDIHVPRPEAFIFQKGLAFNKRRDAIKKAKDLYYLFDIIAGYPDIAESIQQGMARFRSDRPKWFQQLIKNLNKYFIDEGAAGPRMIVDQRSEDAYKTLDDDQLEHYCRSKIDEFVSDIS